ncbi:MAG: 8-amino-7-oxononanoate synthase, partial [Verrucomicrobiales bacterium]|nr:8-amino-7-oxononanoate synthase [Verrucomicrobiales bacterium]
MPRDPKDQLQTLREQHLYRQLRPIEQRQGNTLSIDGKTYLNFSSNDYLGLSRHPDILHTYQNALSQWGVGAGSSRLICGTLQPHLELEQRLAELKKSEAALTFSSGYATAIGTITALAKKGDILILDKLCHASLIDGARLSAATLRIYPHNHTQKLESHLQWASKKIASDGRIIVITESIFSMDGDLCPLADIVELKEKYGALLLLDEAHALGVIGTDGLGLAHQLDLCQQVDLQMGTLSKALGLSGGYLCASRAAIDLMINRSRSFIYSTAPSAAIPARLSSLQVRSVLPSTYAIAMKTPSGRSPTSCTVTTRWGGTDEPASALP